MNMTRPVTILLVFLLVGACQRDELMAAGKPLSHWKKEATQVSWFSFWNSEKDERRHMAFRRLSEIGEPAIPALVDLAREHDGPVRSGALDVLATMGPRAASAVPELIEMLNDGPTDLRLNVAWTIGRIGPAAERAVPSLTPLLRHPDAGLRYAAAQALAQIGGPGHAALEETRTQGDVRQRAASLRGMAARSLDAASRREIIAAGLADSSADVRLRAVALLMPVGRDEAEALAPYLVMALNDPDREVNEAAHVALSVQLQRNAAPPHLLAAVLSGGDASARADVAWRLGVEAKDRRDGVASWSDPAVVTALLAALHDQDPTVRIYAGRALAYGGGAPKQKGIQRLRRDMRTVEPILAVRAARALWDVSHDFADVQAAYRAGLADSAKWTRVETISAIGDLGEDAALFVNQLEQLMTDPAPEVRDRAGKIMYVIQARRTRAETR